MFLKIVKQIFTFIFINIFLLVQFLQAAPKTSVKSSSQEINAKQYQIIKKIVEKHIKNIEQAAEKFLAQPENRTAFENYKKNQASFKGNQYLDYIQKIKAGKTGYDLLPDKNLVLLLQNAQKLGPQNALFTTANALSEEVVAATFTNTRQSALEESLLKKHFSASAGAPGAIATLNTIRVKLMQLVIILLCFSLTSRALGYPDAGETATQAASLLVVTTLVTTIIMFPITMINNIPGAPPLGMNPVDVYPQIGPLVPVNIIGGSQFTFGTIRDTFYRRAGEAQIPYPAAGINQVNLQQRPGAALFAEIQNITFNLDDPIMRDGLNAANLQRGGEVQVGDTTAMFLFSIQHNRGFLTPYFADHLIQSIARTAPGAVALDPVNRNLIYIIHPNNYPRLIVPGRSYLVTPEFLRQIGANYRVGGALP